MSFLTCEDCPKYSVCSKPCEWLEMHLQEKGISVGNVSIENIDTLDASLAIPERLSNSEKSRLKIVFVSILSRRQLEIFRLYSKNLTHNQIAKHLGISQPAVAQAMKRIKKQIRIQFNAIIKDIIRVND